MLIRRRWIVGGRAEVESKSCESQETAKTDGGEGCVSWGESSFEFLSEYACTEFCREVVKNRFPVELPAYLSRLT